MYRRLSASGRGKQPASLRAALRASDTRLCACSRFKYNGKHGAEGPHGPCGFPRRQNPRPVAGTRRRNASGVFQQTFFSGQFAHPLLQFLKCPDLDLPDAFAADAINPGQILQRFRGL